MHAASSVSKTGIRAGDEEVMDARGIIVTELEPLSPSSAGRHGILGFEDLR
jgi:hypothetical protein